MHVLALTRILKEQDIYISHIFAYLAVYTSVECAGRELTEGAEPNDNPHFDQSILLPLSTKT